MSAVASFAAVVAGEGEVSIVEADTVMTAITANKANICGSNNRGDGVPLLAGKAQREILCHGDGGERHTDDMI